MHFLPDFLMGILRATPRPDGGREKMVIIIRQPYAYLEAELRRTFERQEGVEVIVDRRSPERRQSRYPVNGEQLRADQRRLKEEILEVVISD